jgi:hypothetical protein
MLLIALATVAVAWAAVTAMVVGVCASAASGDRTLLGATALRRAGYTLPRRSTWRTVRISSFRSCQSDQLAT